MGNWQPINRVAECPLFWLAPQRDAWEEMKHWDAVWVVGYHSPAWTAVQRFDQFLWWMFPSLGGLQVWIKGELFLSESQKMTKSAGFIHRQTENDDTTENDVDKTDDQ